MSVNYFDISFYSLLFIILWGFFSGYAGRQGQGELQGTYSENWLCQFCQIYVKFSEWTVLGQVMFNTMIKHLK